MSKIKVVGALILILSMVLFFLSSYVHNENREYSTILNLINREKASTQEVSKTIFYMYRNSEKSSNKLNKSIEKYLKNSKLHKNNFTKKESIITLLDNFYSTIQKFRTQQKISTGYNPIITAKLVNNIYHNNLLLDKEFNRVLEFKELEFNRKIKKYAIVEKSLFFILIGLLLYLFTEIHLVIEFIQKFSKTSKDILEKSTIKNLETIDIEQEILQEATQNYNNLVDNINLSIHYSIQSLQHTTKSLESVAKNIEDFMELLSTMQEDKTDSLFEKEDAVIDSLEELMRLRKKLKKLQTDLDNLT